MLTRVDITNYRGFQSYRMEGLARVNLLVGKNNSGKTTLLEGIQFLTSGGDPAVLAEIAERRGEAVPGRPDWPTLIVDIAHFFHGHKLTRDASFSLAGDDGWAPVSVKTSVHRNGRTKPDESPPSASGVYLHVSGPATEHGERSAFPISQEGGVELRIPARSILPATESASPAIQFVGPESLDSARIAEMWDEVTLSGHEDDVVEAMQTIDADLESVHFLSGIRASRHFLTGMRHFSSRGGVVVGMKGHKGRLPLGSMGDGIRRLMVLATCLTFTKGGFLLVDEIDTGLHYSIMTDMWRLIIETASKSDIQVIATTHSWDCLEGLSRLCEDAPHLASHVAVHSVARNLPHSVVFTGASIVGMVKHDIDPR